MKGSDEFGTQQWQHASQLAASVCVKVSEAGGTADDALRLFEVPLAGSKDAGWKHAQQIIALRLCQRVH